MKHLKDEGIEFIPTTLGVNFILTDDLVFSISVFQIDNFDFESGANNSGRYYNFKISNQELLVGISLGYKIIDNLAIGITVFYHYAAQEYYLAENQLTETYRIENKIISHGLILLAGVKWKPIEEIHLSAAFQYETIPLIGCNDYTVLKSSTSYNESGRRDGSVRLPSKLDVGFAYSEAESFTISFNFIYYFRLEYSAPNDIYFTEYFTNDHIENVHFDISLGGEIYLSDSLVLRLGFFTNTSGGAENIATEKVNLYGGSIGASFITEDITLSIGSVFQYGCISTKALESTHRSSWEMFSAQILIGSTIYF